MYIYINIYIYIDVYILPSQIWVLRTRRPLPCGAAPSCQANSCYQPYLRMYSLISFRKSAPPKNRQLVVHYYLLKYQVDGYVVELTSKTDYVSDKTRRDSQRRLPCKAIPSCQATGVPRSFETTPS